MTTTTPSTPLRRALAALLVATALLFTPAFDAVASARGNRTPPPAPAYTMTVQQRTVVKQINASRTNRSRGGLNTSRVMNDRAQRWAIHLAQCRCLDHRRGPFGALPGWCSAAENVGRSGGGSVGSVHGAFMASSGHRNNILNRRWTSMGVGAAVNRFGEWFVVHAFADYRC
jgi:uncharacterized protein YkwD